MCNIAQTINVLQAMILTDKEKFLLTPTYHVFRMYKVHQGATYIPVELNSPQYTIAEKSIPALHATASRDATGKLHLSVVNLDPNHGAELSVKIAGASAKDITGEILTAPEMNAMNTFENPTSVKPAEFKDFSASAETVSLKLPSKAVVVLEMK
jgi:alpha-N-arabinofuranosidase